MRKFLAIVKLELKLFIRQKASVFYTFFFPLICLFIFANIWGKFPGYIDTLTSGLTAMISLNIAVFGAALVLSFYRQYGFYKRLVITPVKEIIYILGLIVSRLIILFVVVNIFFLCSYFVFGFRPNGSILDMNLMLFVGTLSLTALALFIVSLGNNQSQIIQAANLLFFPMLFLGGTFYSLEHIPTPLKIIAYIFPYTYLVQGLNNIAVKGKLFYQNPLELLVLLIWLLVCLFFTVKRFKSEEVF